MDGWLAVDGCWQDTGKYCFMVEDTLKALDLGAVETLVVWENLETMRYTVRDNSTQEEKVLHLSKEQEHSDTHLRDPVSLEWMEGRWIFIA